MYDLFLTVILIVSGLMILVVALQPTKTMNASDAFIGGGSQIYGKQKARGFEAFLRKMTIYLGVLFFGIAILLTVLR